ncbi:MAG TPA: EAL domain-containing protein [Jatrophihabitans sp.]|jgi:diguanylate cyclase (GGDEF)-like protein
MELAASRRRAALAIGIVLVAGFAVVLRIAPGGPFVTQAFDDIGEAVAAALGAAACLWRAARSAGRWRLSWAFLGSGLAAWSLGECVWSYYEVFAGSEVPFPSLADAGYLLFPVCCLIGLFVRPSAAFVGRARLRVLLDGAMVVASLFILSWASALGAVYHAGAQNTFGLVVSLAYPASDLMLITVVVLVASRARLDAGLVLLAGGLLSMAVADSAFAYLVAAGTYGTGAFTDVAWVAAFLAIGVSALFPVDAAAARSGRVEGSAVALAVPYLLVIAGTAALFVGIVRNLDTPVTLAVELVAIGALLLRQLIVVLDNRRLTQDVMAQQEELTHRAFHDPLTGLANRALFFDRVSHALDLRRRVLRPVSVIFVDLDDFKSVNDAFGHETGDVVLTEVAGRLAATCRTGDTVARLGGDEFAVLLEDAGDPELAAQRLLAALRSPVRVGDRLVPVCASVGSTTLDADAEIDDTRELLRQADLAMYAAKRSGKNTVVSYLPSLRSAGEDDLERRIALHADVAAARIGTVFQPIVWTASGELFAMEALARWQFRGQPVSPAEFIPLADRGGFLDELDLVVAGRAMALADALPYRGSAVLVSTNVGLRHHSADLVGRLTELLASSPVHPSRLVVEVSEQDALDDADSGATLALLRESGVRIAIDDFGIGYSNLARLEALRPDILKLDRSFVAPLASGLRGVLLGRVVELAHDLGAIVVAEGVETEVQREILAELGCDALQGFLIAPPAEYVADVA